MALTITGAVSVATADHFEIRTMLFAALGCNLAWGIIDGGMYLMAPRDLVPSHSHRKLATAGTFSPGGSTENVTKPFHPSSLFFASNSE
jgi:hypothetical protein